MGIPVLVVLIALNSRVTSKQVVFLAVIDFVLTGLVVVWGLSTNG